MKPRTKYSLVLFLTLTFLSISAAVQAAGNSQVLLSAKQNTLKIGQETSVEILIKNAPAIYGVDVQVTFDPKILEVVDADKKQPGIQLEPGKFIDGKKSFFLAHQIDNEKGTINYALTLLNPAPAVQGDGQLAQITFRAKANGSTVVTVKKGKFGTKTGETISPDLAGVQVIVSDKKESITPTPTPKIPGQAKTADNMSALVGLASAGFLAISLGGWLWLRHIGRV